MPKGASKHFDTSASPEAERLESENDMGTRMDKLEQTMASLMDRFDRFLSNAPSAQTSAVGQLAATPTSPTRVAASPPPAASLLTHDAVLEHDRQRTLSEPELDKELTSSEQAIKNRFIQLIEIGNLQVVQPHNTHGNVVFFQHGKPFPKPQFTTDNVDEFMMQFQTLITLFATSRSEEFLQLVRDRVYQLKSAAGNSSNLSIYFHQCLPPSAQFQVQQAIANIELKRNKGSPDRSIEQLFADYVRCMPFATFCLRVYQTLFVTFVAPFQMEELFNKM